MIEKSRKLNLVSYSDAILHILYASLFLSLSLSLFLILILIRPLNLFQKHKHGH